MQIGGGRVFQRTNDYINFFCNIAALPSVEIPTVNTIGQEFMGISRETPSGMRFSKPFTISVIENSNFSVYKDMRRWMNMTIQNTNVGVGSTTRNQRMNFYTSYVSTITLTKLELPDNQEYTVEGMKVKNIKDINSARDLDGHFKKSLVVHFNNAYPVKIGEVTLASDNNTSPLLFSIEFMYETYSIPNLLDQDNIGFPDLPPLSKSKVPIPYPVLPLSGSSQRN